MPYRIRNWYMTQALLWAFIIVGVLVNGYVNHHQEIMNQRSIQHRQELERRIEKLEKKDRNRDYLTR